MSTDRIAQLRAEGEAAVAAARDTAELEQVRLRFLGRAANEARRAVEAAVQARQAELEATELEERLARDVVDVTLPGAPVTPVGHLHVLTATRREIEDVFVGLGFRVAEGPEVDLTYYN